jgi:hypothetical protein
VGSAAGGIQTNARDGEPQVEMLTQKHKLTLFLKNTFGWSTNRKIVVFSVDDYGNIRVASPQARINLRSAGLNMDRNRFDQFDSLDTAEDLTQLFDTLTSVKDKEGRAAVFTAFALPANIDFEKMERTGYERYWYQLLPDTLNSLPACEGAWLLWKQGMNEKIFLPQFHGREHANVNLLMRLLREKNPDALACMKERSWAAINSSGSKTVSYVSAFSFNSFDENVALGEIATDGLNVFEKVFGYRATHFNAPGSPAHTTLEKHLAAGGIKYIDTSFIKKEHQGNGKYAYKFNYQGKQNRYKQLYQVRNCVFEPLMDRKADSVSRTLAEMEIAFKCGKPAVISSHRVNFCGGIDVSVREHGLRELKRLLQSIVKKWPDVEFMAAHELGDLMSNR